jgi:hypothetical protein
MKSSTRKWSTLSAGATAAALAGCLTLVGHAQAIPDPCALITVSELTQIVGPLKGAPKPGDIKNGDVSCEYTPARAPGSVIVLLQQGDLDYWKSRNGGKNPVAAPELGAGAFVNPDFAGSTDVYAKKGSLVLRVSMPKGPTAIDSVKAIAKKALARL